MCVCVWGGGGVGVGLCRVLSVTVSEAGADRAQDSPAALQQFRGEECWGGGQRFPVLPTALGVNASVKRWITAQHI